MAVAKVNQEPQNEDFRLAVLKLLEAIQHWSRELNAVMSPAAMQAPEKADEQGHQD